MTCQDIQLDRIGTYDHMYVQYSYPVLQMILDSHDEKKKVLDFFPDELFSPPKNPKPHKTCTEID